MFEEETHSVKLDAIELISHRGSDSPTPLKPAISLHKAARDGRVKEVEGWMHHMNQTKINKRDEDGYTAFHYAAKYNHLQIMRTLVENKADPKLCTEVGGYTALHLAAQYKRSSHQDEPGGAPEICTNEEMVSFLVEEKHKLDVNAKAQYDTYPLHIACSRGNKAAVEVLLRHKDIKRCLPDANNDTVLHEACTTNNVELLELLLEKLNESGELDDILSSKNDTGHTPLHVSCAYGQPGMAAKLLGFMTKKAHVDGGNPPLLLACSQEKQEVVTEFLKLEGLNLLSCRKDGATILHLVAERGWKQAASILIHHEHASSLVKERDNNNRTPLHYAATKNNADIIKLLVKEGKAEVDAVDKDEQTPLLVAASLGHLITFTALKEEGADLTRTDFNRKSAVYLAAESNHKTILVVAGNDSSLVDYAGNTPLHAAAAHGSDKVLEHLLKGDVKVNATNGCKKTPLHLAAENGHNSFVKKLLESDDVDISTKDEDSNTALHLAAREGHCSVAVTLLNNEADVKARNHVLWTPLDCAAYGGHQQVVELLISKHHAEVDSKDKLQETPLHLAAKQGHVRVVETLMHHNADLTALNTYGANALDLAIENGQSTVAMTIVKSDGWRDAMRNTTQLPQGKGKQTTPMRKLIKKMPDIALEVLNRCTTTNKIRPDHKDYTVTFDYEFLEDFSSNSVDKQQRLLPSRLQSLRTWVSHLRPSHLVTRLAKEFGLEKEGYSTTWGPAGGFDKDNHPLNIMVESMQTKLLDHPLVSSLIAYKWSKAWLFYITNILFYLVFLIFLTSFALNLPNPQSDLCLFISADNTTFGNASGTLACSAGSNTTTYECGECSSSQDFLYFAGSLVVFCVVVRLVMEFFQFLQLHVHYFLSFENWLELLLYSLSLIFMSTLDKTCVCPESWQWQIGALVVFLAWIHLCIFLRKLPQFGLYIVMFEDIVETFVKIAIPALLLVLAFSMAFYMMFFVPSALFSNSPFATPGLSIIKAMTMAVGEMDFETIFRLSSGGVKSIDEVPMPIAYPGVSILLWIVFLILMPILLMNLLTSLAVDDVGQIRSNAEHRKLALQIELVLSTEEAFQVFRPWFLKKKDDIKPNKHSPYLRRVRSAVWAGVDENFTADNIVKTLNKTPSEPIECVQHQTATLLAEIGKLRVDLGMVNKKNRRMETLLKRMAKEMKVDTTVDDEEEDEDTMS